MGFQQSVETLLQVQMLLKSEFSTVDLNMLFNMAGKLDTDLALRYAKQLEELFESVAPKMIYFGKVLDANTDYILNQIKMNRRMRIILRIILCASQIVACYNIILYVMINAEAIPWTVLMVYLSGVYILMLMICFVITVFLVMLGYQSVQYQLMLRSMPDLDRFKRMLSENPFVLYADAIAFNKVTDLAARIMQKDAETEGADMTLDLASCSNISGGKPSWTCNLTDPCALAAEITKPLSEYLFESLKKKTGCTAHLKQALKMLEELRSGSKLVAIDQIGAWNAIHKEVENIKMLVMTQYQTGANDVMLADDDKLAVIDSIISDVLMIRYVETSMLKPDKAPLNTDYFDVQNKTECYHHCVEDADCQMCHVDGMRCYLHTNGTTLPLQYTKDAGDTMLVKFVSDVQQGYVCNKSMGIATAVGTKLIPAPDAKETEHSCLTNEACQGYYSEPNTTATTTPEAKSFYATTDGVQVGSYVKAFDFPSTPSNQAINTSAKFCVKTSLATIKFENQQAGMVGALRELAPKLQEVILDMLSPYGTQLSIAEYREYIHRALIRFYTVDDTATTSTYYESHVKAIIDSIIDGVDKAMSSTMDDINAYRFVTLKQFNTTLDTWSSKTYEVFFRDMVILRDSVAQYLEKYRPRLNPIGMYLNRPIIGFATMILLIILVNYLFMAFNDYAWKNADIHTIVRRCIMAICAFGFCYALAVSINKKYKANVEYNLTMTNNNGERLLGSIRGLVKSIDGGAEFEKQLTLRLITTSSGNGTANVQRQQDSSNAIIINKGNNKDIPQTDMLPAGVTTAHTLLGIEYMELKLTTPMAQINVTSIVLSNGTLRRDYYFRKSNSELAQIRTGQTVKFYCMDGQSWENTSLSDKWKVRIATVPVLSSRRKIWMHMKNIIDRYDACNSVNAGIRSLPFPSTEIAIYIIAVLFTLAIVIYVVVKLHPQEKIANINMLNEYRKRIKYGETITNLDYVLTCCKTPSSTWNMIVNLAIIIAVLLCIMIIMTIMRTSATYKQGLYTSGAYRASRCTA